MSVKKYTKEQLLSVALNEHFDAAARSTYMISSSNGDLDYAHIVDEEIDALESKPEPEISFTKKEYRDNNFDLSSFRPQTQLHPKIWINGQLNSKVRLRLLDIADDFIKTLDLTGSLANYNWSKFSDFDLHIVIDFEEVDERVNFVKDYFDAKKKLWNEQHENLKIYGFPVEVYVQDANEYHTASGVYSLELGQWLKEPSKNSIQAIKLNKFYIKEQVLKFIKRIDMLEAELDGETDEYKLEQISLKAKALFDKIKAMRREALKNGNEMSSNNIVFKCLRRVGYIGKLVDIKAKTYDKIFSIK